jgi:hypothetical protein
LWGVKKFSVFSKNAAINFRNKYGEHMHRVEKPKAYRKVSDMNPLPPKMTEI